MKSVMVCMVFVSCLLPFSEAIASVDYHPRFTLTEEYNDNIFLTHNDLQEDWVTTVEPGIGVVYNSASIDFNLDYALHYQSYANNNNENIDSFEDMQRANATVLLFKGRPFTLRASEIIDNETLDARNNSSPDNELVNRTTVYHLTVVPEYNLRLAPSFSLVLGYSYNRIDYVAAAGIDSEENAGKVSLVKDLSASSQVAVTYRYAKQNADSDNGYDRQDYSLSLMEKLSPRTKGTIEGGFTEVDYDRGGTSDNIRWLLDLLYQVSEPFSLSLNYSRDFLLSITDGLTKTRSAKFSMNYVRNDFSSSVETYWDKSKYVEINREDEIVGIRAKLHLPLTKAVFTDFDVDYEYAIFTTTFDEDVNRYGIGAAIGMEYRRVLTSLGYRYRINNSDINNNDYRNNIITLSAALRF